METLKGLFLDGLVVVLFVVFVAAVLVGGAQERTRLIKQCMADGYKEYQCRAALTSNSAPVLMPIIIPMR